MSRGSASALKVAQISFHIDPAQRRPGELLQAWPTLADVAQAVALGGARVSVVQASAHRDEFTGLGVGYHFLPLGRLARTSSERAALNELLARLDPDVLHVQGLGFPQEVLDLAARAPGIPIVLQDHANVPPRPWRRPLWRRGLAAARGVAFCAREQAEPFLRAGLLRDDHRVYEVTESSSRFQPGDAAQARAATGLTGDPCLLWVGHLDANKDPLTVLEGVAFALRDLPGLQLWCCFGKAPLIDPVRRRIETDARLAGRVHLLGTVPHERVQTLMQAADFLVLGSHREGCNYSVLEALACGLPPVVTDLPSMRRLTGNGAAGALWPCGDARSLARALASLAAQPAAMRRAAARERFDGALSSEALGRAWCAVYRDLASDR